MHSATLIQTPFDTHFQGRWSYDQSVPQRERAIPLIAISHNPSLTAIIQPVFAKSTEKVLPHLVALPTSSRCSMPHQARSIWLALEIACTNYRETRRESGLSP